MIILGISDPGHVMWRQFQQGQRRFETAGFADTGGKNHHGAFVENDLQLKPELADCLKNTMLVRLAGRNNTAPRRYWRLARSQCIKEDLGWFGRKQRLLAGLWIEKKAAILGDDQIKKRNLGKNLF